MTCDRELDWIAIYISKLNPYDPYKETIVKEYEKYRDWLESIPVGTTIPGDLVYSISSLHSQLHNYVVLGNSNNPLTPFVPVIDFGSITEKDNLLQLINTNSTFIANNQQKSLVLIGYLDGIDYKDTTENIFATISYVIEEYKKCKFYSNALEQKIAQAKYFYVLRLIYDGATESANEMISDFDSDMLLFIHLRHKDSVNNLLKSNKAILANEMYHFLNEYNNERLNDLEFWKVLAQIEDSNRMSNNTSQEIAEETPETDSEELIQKEVKSKIGFFSRFRNQKYVSDTFSIVSSSSDYLRIELLLFNGYIMPETEYNKFIKRIKKISKRNHRCTSEITITVVNHTKVHSYDLTCSVSINKILKSVYDCFNQNVSSMIIDLDLSNFSFGVKIPENCFRELPIKRVKLPSDVESIGNRAFYSCHNLTQVIFTKNGTITKIGEEAFRKCGNLNEFDLSNQFVGRESLGEYCFAECNAIQNFNAGNLLEVIPKGCFYECTNLQSVMVTNLTIIEESAFENCKQLYKIGVCSSLMVIEKNAFCNCISLTSFNFPTYCGEEDELLIGEEAFSHSGLKELYLDCEKLSLGEKAFSYTKLTKVTIYSTLKSLPEGLFFRCESLMEVALPQSLEIIESLCFYECRKLIRIKLPQSLKVIGSYCFEDCLLLREINVPDSLKFVDENAFSGCPLDKDVVKAIKQKIRNKKS